MGTGASTRDKVSKICLSLPHATRELKGSHAAFRAGGKIFAYYLHDHHGDGIESICCKVPPGENTALVTAQPERFYLPAYIGPRGWVALRLDRGKIGWEEAGELLRHSYRSTVPKRMAAQVKL